MSTKIKHNLFALKRELEIEKGNSYTWTDIGHRTGIHKNTLQNMAGNKTKSIDLEIAAKLIDFFSDEGLPVSMCDLVTVEQPPTT